MKFALVIFLLTSSLSSFARDVYNCDFFGPNYLLTIEDNASITLTNNFHHYSCEKGTVNFPGTELELKVINCVDKNSKVTFYTAEVDNGDIILSRNLGITPDINCKKIQ